MTRKWALRLQMSPSDRLHLNICLGDPADFFLLRSGWTTAKVIILHLPSRILPRWPLRYLRTILTHLYERAGDFMTHTATARPKFTWPRASRRIPRVPAVFSRVAPRSVSMVPATEASRFCSRERVSSRNR